ncbi:MAG TPA: bifunctional methylenetetrahydrofolate dehydrogenase/methenyltetrahydrofolate cyclohydrolase FolD [Gemmatimonadales bacterium]|jgi:methylenetetrahydrofolate dehydrogenase (NADP+)/methenyltetrahydrofolate cyclohydrolase|nr:bifunctional methylenetetrahydrofolate dehydrogenase/methenyltetrahydrofolate cyclohydrolase FolD [Gemmatimonadales bacterium]
MTARLLEGAPLADAIRAEVAAEVRTLKARGVTPGLCAVLVGDDPASQTYVASKGKATEEAGMYSRTVRLPATTSQAELLALLDTLNADPQIHGILCQLPVPRHIDTETVLNRVDPRKDVDGFHPINVGKLVLGDPTAFKPATPYGVQQMLIRSGIETKGAHAVVIGRSTLVGKPMANLLIQGGPGGDATVTICHSRSRDLPAIARTADILIVAIGKPEFVKGDWIKPGATVIDVGINRIPDPSKKSGHRLVGDVAFAEAREVAGAITPVPGGVGKMTIAMLLANTLQAARLQAQGA